MKKVICSYCGSEYQYWQKVSITQWALFYTDGTVADIGADANGAMKMKYFKKKYCAFCRKLIKDKKEK